MPNTSLIVTIQRKLKAKRLIIFLGRQFRRQFHNGKVGLRVQDVQIRVFGAALMNGFLLPVGNIGAQDPYGVVPVKMLVQRSFGLVVFLTSILTQGPDGGLDRLQ